MSELLKVKNLCISFGSGASSQEVVHGIDFEVRSGGETVAVLGESGSGKSVSCLALTRLLPEGKNCSIGGSIEFDGQSILTLSEGALRKIRGGGIAYIFQDPSVSLNPVFTVPLMYTIWKPYIRPLVIHAILSIFLRVKICCQFENLSTEWRAVIW